MEISPQKSPHLSEMIGRQLEAFPEHGEYLEKRFAEADEAEIKFAEEISEKVLRIAGDQIPRVCEDYKWLCGEILEEELFFRRHDRYQLSTFSEAMEKVYGNHDYMAKYVNGILASQLWWRNHSELLRFHRDKFIAGHGGNFTHLEVGPGHGLFLYLAASSPNCERAEGWDVSDASLEATAGALRAMGIADRVKLTKMHLMDATGPQFKSITFSEVLEHLEDPVAALRQLYSLLADDGRIFVNAPVNSPAPDHLYLFRTPEEVVEMMKSVGFKVEQTIYAPPTGATLERARKMKLSISTGVIATK